MLLVGLGLHSVPRLPGNVPARGVFFRERTVHFRTAGLLVVLADSILVVQLCHLGVHFPGAVKAINEVLLRGSTAGFDLSTVVYLLRARGSLGGT